MRTLLLVATVALLASHAHGASMVRFINAVPPKESFEAFTRAYSEVPKSADQTWTTTPTQNPVGYHPFSNVNHAQTAKADRIGFEYFPSSLLKQPTVVWTEPVDILAAAANKDSNAHVAPFYFLNALPAIRPYHQNKVAGSIIADRVTLDAHMSTSSKFGTQTTTDEENTQCYAIPASYDCLDQSALKLEGIPGYISFAAGQYKLRAYGVLPNVPEANNQHLATSNTEFGESEATFTFEDNSLYTIVAIGEWTHTLSASTSHDVRLVLFKENTSPTAFGKAAIRFFNALSLNKDADGNRQSVDVYQGQNVQDSTRLISDLPYGETSEYVEVNPGTSVFPLADKTPTTLSSQTAAVTVNLPAGTRATSFCSVTSATAKIVFCRMIPTRVVAYVRLVADTGSLPTLVQGKFGPQKISETELNVYQSIDYPLMEYVEEQYSLTGSAPGQNGLYPVLGMVAPGSVSGYGEVVIPLFIHDSATAPTVGYSCYRVVDAATNAYGGSCTNLGAGTSADMGIATQIGSSDQASTFKYSARFKRVNLFVKTDGYATLTARYEDKQGPAQQYSPGVGANARETNEVGGSPDNVAARFARFTAVDLTRAGPFIDRYMEPGHYYSMYIKACDRTYAVNGNNGKTKTPPPAYAGVWAARQSTDTQQPGLKCPYVDFSASNKQGFLRNTALPDKIPAPDSLLFGWSQDMDRIEDANGFEASDFAKIQFTPFDAQNFKGDLVFTKQSTGNNPLSLTISLPNYYKFNAWTLSDDCTTTNAKSGCHTLATPVASTATGYFDSPRVSAIDAVTQIDEAWRPANTWHSLPAGTYTYTYSAATDVPTTQPASDKCLDTIPTTTAFEVEAGMRYTLYVLNEYGCKVDGTAETSKLSVKIVPVAAAGTKGTGGVSQHAVGNNGFFAGAAAGSTGVPSFNSATASTLSANLVVLLAAVFGVVALLF